MPTVLQRSDLVFRGTAIAVGHADSYWRRGFVQSRGILASFFGWKDGYVDDWTRSYRSGWVAEVSVEERFKGTVREAVRIHTDISSCGILFTEGHEYVVFALQYPDTADVWWTDVCVGTLPIQYGEPVLAELRELTGQPPRPKGEESHRAASHEALAYTVLSQIMPTPFLPWATLLALLLLTGVLSSANVVVGKHLVNGWLFGLCGPALVTAWALWLLHSFPAFAVLSIVDKARFQASVVASAIPALLLGAWRGARVQEVRRQQREGSRRSSETDGAG